MKIMFKTRLTVAARNKQRMSREMADFLYSRSIF